MSVPSNLITGPVLPHSLPTCCQSALFITVQSEVFSNLLAGDMMYLKLLFYFAWLGEWQRFRDFVSFDSVLYK